MLAIHGADLVDRWIVGLSPQKDSIPMINFFNGRQIAGRQQAILPKVSILAFFLCITSI